MDEDLYVDIYELPAHTYDDDGFQAKCFAGGTETAISCADATVECPSCHQHVAPVFIGTFPHDW